MLNIICSVLLLNAGSLRNPPGLYVFHLASADSLLLLSLPFVRDFEFNKFKNHLKLFALEILFKVRLTD